MPDTIEGTVIEASELAVVIRDSQIAPDDAQSLLAAFQPSFMAAKELVNQAAVVTVTDATQVTEIKASRALRLKLREVRVEAEKVRKALKEDSLRRGKAIDGMNNILLMLIKPAEDRLEAQEKFAERKEAERKAALKKSREELLAPFGIDTAFYSLADMPDETFAQLFESSRMAHEAKLERERQAEAQRVAAEAARVAEEKRIREENERLRLEQEAKERELEAERRKAEQERIAAEARERAIREEAEKERRAAEAKAQAERQAIENKARVEREAAEARERAAQAKAKAERDAIEAQARADREARERMEREAEERRAAEEAEAAAKAEAERVAAAAPDYDKLIAFAATVNALEVPSVTTAEAKIIANDIAVKARNFAKWIKDQAKKLAKLEEVAS